MPRPRFLRQSDIESNIMNRIYTFLLTMMCTAGLWAAVPNGYYTTCEGKSGAALLSQLEKVVGPHTNVGYDGLWSLYQSSDAYSNGKIWDMYSTKQWTYKSEQCGSYKNVGDCYNREHSMPKSWFDEAAPMVSDAFHIYPTDGKVNGQRSNFPYGECASGTTLAGSGSVKALGKLGKSTFSGYSGTVFEPDDEYKGDFARSYFYMAAAYNSQVKNWDSDMLAGNSYPAFTTWTVNLLLKWHAQDPVSQKELDRNEAVYRAQGNRNPFIDHPELVDHIWGDKKNTAWTGDAADPEITLPVSGSTVNLGATMVGVPRTAAVVVKGVALTGTVNVAVSGNGFSASTTSFGASAACTTGGYTVTVTFNPSASGAYSGTLRISCGSLSITVTLTGSAAATIPAGPVVAVSDRAFEAVWTNVGDDNNGKYTLNVMSSGASLSGYPLLVDAADERYVVENLEPSTQYTYTVSSRSHTSAVVSVTTLDPIPSIDVLFDGNLSFVALPGQPSDVAELLLDIENIDDDITCTVNAPFQLSDDKSSWSGHLVISPEQDRIYLRMLSDAAGSFNGKLIITSGGYTNDDVTFTGTVGGDFAEDFEANAEGFGSYSGGIYQGSAARWRLTNAGIYPADEAHGGDQAVRFGKNTDSAIEMQESTRTGLGVVTLWAHKWSNDANAVFVLEYSVNEGATWQSAGSATLSSAEYTEYSFTLNTDGPTRLRLRQTSGSRWLVDDIKAKAYSGLVPENAADYHTWDAFCRGGDLVVEASEPADVRIYSIDGTELYAGNVAGELILNAAPGLYIVAVDSFARRVLVK